MTLTILSGALLGQSETIVVEEWATHKGTQNIEHHTKSITDANKNIYIVGSSINGTGNYDILVVKYDKYGVQQWDDQINGTASGDDHGADIIFDNSGNILVTGTVLNNNTSNDLVLRKYNTSGVVQWTKYFNGSASLPDGGASICIGASNTIYVAGGTYSSTNLSDYLILKYNSSGALQWSQVYDYIGLHEVAAKILLRNGDLVVSGISQINSGKWEIATLSMNPSNGNIDAVYRTGGTAESIDEVTDIAIDDDENIYIVGAVENTGTGLDMKIVKLDENMNLVWTQEVNGSDNLDDLVNNVYVDDNENVYITGYISTSNESRNVYTAKYNSSGTQLWNTIYNGESSGRDTGKSLTLDSSGNIYVAASSYRVANSDYCTIKYDNSGNELWMIHFNSEADLDDKAIDIGLDDAGDIIVVGQSDYYNGYKRYYTVKYSEKDVILPPDDEVCSTQSAYRLNKGQIFNNTGVASDVDFYNNNSFPATYCSDENISFLFASIDSLNTDTLHRIDMVFNKSNPKQKFYATGETGFYEQYYHNWIDHDSRTRIPSYRHLFSKEIFPGVDVVMTGNSKGMKYYLICKPGFNAYGLGWEFTGQDGLSVNGPGDLVVSSSIGDLVLVKGDAFTINGSGNRVYESWQPSYSVIGPACSLILGSFNTSETLIIEIDSGEDIVSGVNDIDNLDWSSYLSRPFPDFGNDIEVSSESEVYQTGSVDFYVFPDFPGVDFENNLDVNFADDEAYLTKMNDFGVPLWGAYYGTPAEEHGLEIELDSEGNILFCGDQFPSTVFDLSGTDGFQPSGGGARDGFLAKISSDGYLLWSTYFGGLDVETIRDMAISQTTGNVVIVGGTHGAGYPLQDAGGYYRPVYNSGLHDGFITEVSSNGGLVWSTYFGNSLENGDTEIGGASIDSGNDSRLVITGYTNDDGGENNEIVTAPCNDFAAGFPLCDPGSAYIDSEADGFHDTFISEFNLTNHSLMWSTLYGGSGREAYEWSGELTTLNSGGNSYDVIAGDVTLSTGFDFEPGNSGSYHQTSLAGGAYDIYVAHFLNRQLTWSTFFGGDGEDAIFDLAFDSQRNLYFTGSTNTMIGASLPNYCMVPINGGIPLCQAYPITWLESLNSGEADALIFSFNDEFELQWSTFFGGTGTDNGRALSIDPQTDKLYIAGATFSDEDIGAFPLDEWLPQSYFQGVHAGSVDSYFSRFRIDMMGGPVGLDDFSTLQDIGLFMIPNPIQGHSSLIVNTDIENTDIIVYNSLGQIVFDTHISFQEQGIPIQLDMSTLQSGVYYLKVTSLPGYNVSFVKE